MLAPHLVSPRQALILEQRARALRASPTPAEHLLWQHLAGSRLGVAFQRQLVIGRHIVDFTAPKPRLVVELDGGYHVGRERKDTRRDAELQRLGWRTTHFRNNGITFHLNEILIKPQHTMSPSAQSYNIRLAYNTHISLSRITISIMTRPVFINKDVFLWMSSLVLHGPPPRRLNDNIRAGSKEARNQCRSYRDFCSFFSPWPQPRIVSTYLNQRSVVFDHMDTHRTMRKKPNVRGHIKLTKLTCRVCHHCS